MAMNLIFAYVEFSKNSDTLYGKTKFIKNAFPVRKYLYNIYFMTHTHIICSLLYPCTWDR